MAIQRRLLFAAVLFALALVLYGTGKYYSTPLILYVVEQSLAQKAPAGIEPRQLRERLHYYLDSAPDKNKKMERLFKISEYLEKVQFITPEELNELIPIGKTATLPAP
jgi:hypothetical protein